MIHLDNAHLDDLGADIATPDYDRKAVTEGIVHIGVGGFTAPTRPCTSMS